ncbi:MAG: polysaccharide deacetylase family protein [Sediminibacterium sp.]|nr:polysaccharide deacetylase family protein [Sediminibacterium sp.]
MKLEDIKWIFLGLLAFFGCQSNGSTDPKMVNEGLKATDSSVIKVPDVETKVEDTTLTYVYVTFDDGPQKGTKEVLELCQQLGIPATFFLVGAHLADPYQKDYLARLKADKAMELANHSYTHAFYNNFKKFYSQPDAAVADFLKAQEALSIQTKIIRFPGNGSWMSGGKFRGPASTKNVAIALDSLGYHVFGWDVEWHFSRKDARPVQSAEKMLAQIEELRQKGTVTKRHIVWLMHDRMFKRPEDLDSLRKVLVNLKSNHSTSFRVASEYPGMNL